MILAKNTNLPDSWVTFFNFLVDSKKKLKNYAGNEELIQEFKNTDCLEIFPIYGPSMLKNMKKGIEMRELYDKSCVLLTDCLPIFNPTHLIIRGALDCLSKKDLCKFLN